MTVTLINPFAVDPANELEFVESWKATAAIFAAEPGYIETRLHESIDPGARFRYVNIAHWASAEAWGAAMKRFPPKEKGQAGVVADPALYTVVPGGSIGATNATFALEASIRSSEKGLADAYQANDVGFLDRVLMDAYVVTDGPGTTSNKAKVLDDHRNARLKVSAFVFDSMDVSPLSTDVAVVSGQYHWTAAYDGHPITGAFRYLRVYVIDGDRGWRVRMGQVTPLLESRP